MVKQADIDAQLQRILASSTFLGSPRATEFLRFCVCNGSGGKALGLKETTIAVEVFNRPPDYNPKSDAIVRVHARRVREKLDEYYRTDGNDDPIRIDLPKGGYVPRISRTLPNRKTDFSDWADPQQNERAPTGDPWPVPASWTSVGSRTIPAIWLLILLPALLIVTLVVMFAHRAKAPSNRLGLLQPLNFPGQVSDPAWSPDGSRLAFTATDATTGVSHVYIKTAHGSAPAVRVTRDEISEVKPVWSPDGVHIAFLKILNLSRFEIVCLHLKDSATQTFGPFNAMAYVTQEHAALDWSPDGKSLLTTEQMSPSSPMRLVLISMVNGERIALTSPPTGSTGDIDGKFSPDGKFVAFRRGGLGDLYVVSSKGEQERPARQLTYNMHGVRGIAWCDNGRSILFGTNEGPINRFGIWKIPMVGGTPQEVTPTDFDGIDPAVSKSGAFVFTHRELVTALTVHSLFSGTPDHELFPSTAIDKGPTLSPDGKMVAFASNRSGWEQLWIGHVGDAMPTQATNFQSKGLVLYASWSPDNHSVAFSFRDGPATNIFIYSVATAKLRQITSTHNRDITPVFGADGKYLYFSSNDDGTSRIWRVRTDGSEHPEPMFWEAVTDYLPSSDGKWMYFVEEGKYLSLIRRNLEDGTSETVFQTAGSPAFSNDIVTANGLVYIAVSTNDTSQANVFQIDPSTKTDKVVAHLTGLPSYEISGFTISPDGQSLITSRTVQNASSLYAETLN